MSWILVRDLASVDWNYFQYCSTRLFARLVKSLRHCTRSTESNSLNLLRLSRLSESQIFETIWPAKPCRCQVLNISQLTKPSIYQSRTYIELTHSELVNSWFVQILLKYDKKIQTRWYLRIFHNIIIENCKLHSFQLIFIICYVNS